MRQSQLLTIAGETQEAQRARKEAYLSDAIARAITAVTSPVSATAVVVSRTTGALPREAPSVFRAR